MERREVVLVIDNYDSFTYNLVQYLGELGEAVVVRRNDEITLPESAPRIAGDAWQGLPRHARGAINL